MEVYLRNVNSTLVFNKRLVFVILTYSHHDGLNRVAWR